MNYIRNTFKPKTKEEEKKELIKDIEKIINTDLLIRIAKFIKDIDSHIDYYNLIEIIELKFFQLLNSISIGKTISYSNSLGIKTTIKVGENIPNYTYYTDNSIRSRFLKARCGELPDNPDESIFNKFMECSETVRKANLVSLLKGLGELKEESTLIKTAGKKPTKKPTKKPMKKL